MALLTFKTLDDFKIMLGKSLPDGAWYSVTQEMINDFASATLDEQWIHINTKKAAESSPFGSTVAHGFMSVSMLSKLLADIFSIESLTMGLNYGLNKVRFPHPIPVNSNLRLLSSVKDIAPMYPNGIKVTFACTIEIEGVEKPACVAEFIVALFEQ